MSKLLIVTGSTTSGKTTHAHDWATRNGGIVADEGNLQYALNSLREGRNVALVINLPFDVVSVEHIHKPVLTFKSYEVAK